ncbi:MAG: EamA family transporter, partial [Gammaproteobacteria bacterium]|nr:EamA family transporter [Gammaproteobacteria bacterium]
MSFTNWGLLVFLSVLWGSAFFFVGIAVIELPPLTIVLVRVGLAALFLLPLLFYLGYS